MNTYIIIVNEGYGRIGIAGTFDSMHDNDIALIQILAQLQCLYNFNKKRVLVELGLPPEYEKKLNANDFILNKDNGFIEIHDYEISLRKLADYKNFNNFYKGEK